MADDSRHPENLIPDGRPLIAVGGPARADNKIEHILMSIKADMSKCVTRRPRGITRGRLFQSRFQLQPLLPLLFRPGLCLSLHWVALLRPPPPNTSWFATRALRAAE